MLLPNVSTVPDTRPVKTKPRSFTHRTVMSESSCGKSPREQKKSKETEGPLKAKAPPKSQAKAPPKPKAKAPRKTEALSSR